MIKSKRKYSAEDIFREAGGWEYSSLLLFNHSRFRRKEIEEEFINKNTQPHIGFDFAATDMDLIISTLSSSFVASSLCLELYLKSIICLETGCSVRGHNLIFLYNKISNSGQQKIQFFCSLEDKDTASNSNSIISRLTEAQNSFEEWRYMYEGLSIESGHNLSSIIWGIRKYILELKPEWNKNLEQVLRN
ncbi:MAG: hypothetical protein WCL61_02815 [bacterium]